MKKFLLITVLSLIGISSFAQSGKSIYNKYSEAEGVSAVYISPAMFRLMGKLPDMSFSDEDIDLSKVVKSLDGFYLLDSENESINRELAADVRKFIQGNEYELMMEVKDDGEVVKMFTIGKGDDITGFVMLSDEKDECTFICMDGHMSREMLESIISKID